MAKYKKYDKSFRQQAVQLALSSDQPTIETAKDLGIQESTLYNWISKAKKVETVAKTESKNKSVCIDVEKLHDELLKLRKDNRRLQETCEILKKATAYFANDQNQDTNS